jgi:DNA-directed RNA polymerase subunit N (RpoN/RPB10)
MLLSLVFSSLSRSSDAAFMYALLPCRRPPAKCSSPTLPRLYPPPPRASAGAASAIRNNAQLRVINEVGRWAFQNYSVSCSKVIAAYFGASVRSTAAFGTGQANDRQRGIVVHSFGVARQCCLRRSLRQRVAQGDAIMCQSTGCSDPLPLLPRPDRALQTDLP